MRVTPERAQAAPRIAAPVNASVVLRAETALARTIQTHGEGCLRLSRSKQPVMAAAGH
jgi:hypothetical protein